MKQFLSILICVLLLLGMVGCAGFPEQRSQESYEKQKTRYADVISQYTELLSAKRNGEELSAPDTKNVDAREAAIAEVLYGIADACKDGDAAENLGYGFKDFDGNGTPELILLSKYTSIYAMFTLSDGLPILLEANVKGRFVFAPKGRFLLMRQTTVDHIQEGVYYICRVDGDKMAYDAIYGQVYDSNKREIVERFRIADGNRTPIDEETFHALNREYQRVGLPDYANISKLEAPQIHFPLVDIGADADLPVADFSSYAAIRKTYLAISTCLDEFNSSEWIQGCYDTLFSFPNDRSFEYYTKLLYTAYRGHDSMGYDEIDLNGDGIDELVLMNEEYRIKAIFTQKEGVPVLLDAFTTFDHTCWLDDEGLIHVDRESYEELEYSLYEFTKDGEYTCMYSILVDNSGRYLTKNGKTEPFDYEESMALYYDEYCRYSEPFTPNEYTRNASDLTYTPLAEATEDMIRKATDKTWHKYAKLEKTTGKDFAHGNTYITFENVSDTQIDVNVKYEFTYSYPDPEREHYMLNETTESFLEFTAFAENGVFVFEGQDLKGSLEFQKDCLWLIIEESADARFAVGNHCFTWQNPFIE